MAESKEKILEIRDLDISFQTTAGMVHAIRGVNLDLYIRRDCGNRWGIRIRKIRYHEGSYGNSGFQCTGDPGEHSVQLSSRRTGRRRRWIS